LDGLSLIVLGLSFCGSDLQVSVWAFPGKVAMFAALEAAPFLAMLFFLGLSNRLSYVHRIQVVQREPRAGGLSIVPMPVIVWGVLISQASLSGAISKESSSAIWVVVWGLLIVVAYVGTFPEPQFMLFLCCIHPFSEVLSVIVIYCSSFGARALLCQY
jgi:hypothetical protein